MVQGLIKTGGMLSVLFFLVAACGELGGSGQCGGAENTGACLRIEKIVPTNSVGANSSSVDAVQVVCNAFEVLHATTTPVKPVPEKFADHSAQITVSNHPLQGIRDEDISDVTLLDFSIEYTQNQCLGLGVVCPDLPRQTVAPGQTVMIPTGASVTFTLPFVPLATKEVFRTEWELKNNSTEPVYPPSYTATYTLTGTDSGKNKVSVKGSAEFTIANYNLCTS